MCVCVCCVASCYITRAPSRSSLPMASRPSSWRACFKTGIIEDEGVQSIEFHANWRLPFYNLLVMSARILCRRPACQIFTSWLRGFARRTRWREPDAHPICKLLTRCASSLRSLVSPSHFGAQCHPLHTPRFKSTLGSKPSRAGI